MSYFEGILDDTHAGLGEPDKSSLSISTACLMNCPSSRILAMILGSLSLFHFSASECCESVEQDITIPLVAAGSSPVQGFVYFQPRKRVLYTYGSVTAAAEPPRLDDLPSLFSDTRLTLIRLQCSLASSAEIIILCLESACRIVTLYSWVAASLKSTRSLHITKQPPADSLSIVILISATLQLSRII